jgi:TonB family protein
MVNLGVLGPDHRRSRLPAVVSLALHGAALLALVALGGKRIAPGPRRSVLIPIEVIQAAPASPSPAPPPPPARTPPAGRPTGRVAAGLQGRREPTPRAQPPAPPAVQSLASLRIRYDDPTSFADRGTARQAGVSGGVASSVAISGLAGAGDLRADGIGSLTIPEPPAGGSLRRGPRVKGDHDRTRIVGASRFAGQTLELRLSIDERGQVRGVQVLQSVDPELDRKTARMVQSFEYAPALDDAGVAIAGTLRWKFEIVEDDGSF